MKLFRILPLLLSVLCIGCNVQNRNIKVVDALEFKTAFEQDRNAILLDVRKPEEFAEGHLAGARQMNWLDEESFKQDAAGLEAGRTIYVYCKGGVRSNAAAKWLAEQGHKVVDLKGGIQAWNESGLPTTLLDSDIFFTEGGRRVEITFIKHGTLMIAVDSFTIHVDPVLMFGTDYATLPKADLLLVTHEHGDHFDKNAVEMLMKAETVFLSNGRVAEMGVSSTAMSVGDAEQVAPLTVTATAAYNSTIGREKFHPQGRDVGYLLSIDNLRIYIAGDTEDIPELADLKDVDVAFLPVNQPYTMTPEQCIHAIEMFMPRMVYPYHYSETDLTPIIEHFRDSEAVEVRVRQMQ